MSSGKDARVGANGDRRQQPALTKSLSGIDSKMQILRKRQSKSFEVDEEEWNRRMQTWEKKRQRLSGSDWDKSYREAVRNRLSGKKPWRTPVIANKPAMHMADRESQPQDGDNSCNAARESPRSEWESPAVDAGLQQNGHRSTKCDGDGKMEVVGLKREASKMELDVTDVAVSNLSYRSGHARAPRQSTNLESQKRQLKDNLTTSEMGEEAEDFNLTRTHSAILQEANNSTQSSARFLKTVLSPIQSESECSKLGTEVQSSDNQNEMEETTDVPLERSSEQLGQCADEEAASKQTDTNETASKSGEKSLINRGQKRKSSSWTSLHDTTVTPVVKESENMEGNTGKGGMENPDPKLREGDKQKAMKKPEKEANKEMAELKHVSSLEAKIETIEATVPCKQLHVKSGKDKEFKNIINSLDPGVVLTCKLQARKLRADSSKSQCHCPVTRKKEEGDRKSRETPHNASSLTTSSSSKERALHAIYSSPDTEIFGGRKKPQVQPLFIRTAFPKDDRRLSSAADDLVGEQIQSNEPFELLAKSRPLSEESLMVLDDSREALRFDSETWYREFQHPVMPSEEFVVTRSDCYREVIIDRSGCRSLFEGPCLAKMSKDFDNRCVMRYEVCHDTSKCSLKHSKKPKRIRYDADNPSSKE